MKASSCCPFQGRFVRYPFEFVIFWGVMSDAVSCQNLGNGNELVSELYRGGQLP